MTPIPWNAAGIVARDYVGVSWRQLRALVARTAPVDMPSTSGVHVVLVPGVWEPWRYLLPLARRLHARGHGVRVVPGLGYNGRPVDDGARLVRTAVETLAGDVVLVAHSKGGLIGKRTLVDWERDRLAGTAPDGVRLAGLVTVATPFGGSSLARLVPLRAIAELRDDTPGLLALAAETEANARIVELVPAWDPHIPSHTPLPGSQVVRLRSAGHFHSLETRETLEAVAAAIERLVAPPPDVRPADAESSDA